MQNREESGGFDVLRIFGFPLATLALYVSVPSQSVWSADVQVPQSDGTPSEYGGDRH